MLVCWHSHCPRASGSALLRILLWMAINILTWCLKAGTSRNRECCGDLYCLAIAYAYSDRGTAGDSFYVACPKVINGHGCQRAQKQENLWCKGQQQFTQLTDWEDGSGSSCTISKAVRLKNMVTSPMGSRTMTDCAVKGQNQFTRLTNRTAGGQSRMQSTIAVTPLTSSKRRPISKHVNGTKMKIDCAGEAQELLSTEAVQGIPIMRSR